MGLMEKQVQAAITIERGEAAISKAVDMMVEKYSSIHPLGEDEFRDCLEMLVKTSKELGAFNEFQQSHLRNG